MKTWERPLVYGFLAFLFVSMVFHRWDVLDLKREVEQQAQANASVATSPDLYYELTIGSFTAVHAYGGFKTYGDAEARVTWLKEQGLMAPTQPYFIQVRILNAPLTVLDAGGR